MGYGVGYHMRNGMGLRTWQSIGFEVVLQAYSSDLLDPSRRRVRVETFVATMKQAQCCETIASRGNGINRRQGRRISCPRRPRLRRSATAKRCG